MKRYGNLYNKICDLDNLKNAHRHARRDKSYYREVKMVDRDPDKYLKKIQDMLLNQTYKVSKYTISTINDKGKERELMKLPYFPDRIIQWAILLQIEPIFLSTFTVNTCASLKGRGIHYANRLMDKYMRDREGTKYCLKLDVKKFYPSIDRPTLKYLLFKKFKDARLLVLLNQIIDSAPGDKGIPIGSYLSQYFANFYLAYFDHWIKEIMRVKYYVRYMDDIIIMSNDKTYLHQLRKEIDHYLTNNLKLTLKDNWQVFPTYIRGVDFVGYRFFGDYKLLRKKTCKNFKRKMRKIRKAQRPINYTDYCVYNSYRGWLQWCDSFRLQKKYIKPIANLITEFYNQNIKKR